MIKKSTLALVFAGLLLIGFAPTAHAQTSSVPSGPSPNCQGTPGSPGAVSTLDTNTKAALGRVGQQRIQAANNVQALFASIDLKIRTCFIKMQGIFMSIGAHGDPMNLIFGLVATEIMNLLNQVCAMALSDMQQLASYAMSQLNRFCLPLPNFGLGGGSLGLQNVTCNGVSLLQPGGSTNGKDPVNFTIGGFLLPPKSSQ